MSRAELNQLLDVVLPFAHDQLAKRGAFAPFAVGLDLQGKPNFAMAEGKDSKEMIASMRERLRAKRASLRAAAICYDVRLREGDGAEQAIAVSLEDVDGEALLVFEPYRRRGQGELEYLALTGERATSQVFAP